RQCRLFRRSRRMRTACQRMTMMVWPEKEQPMQVMQILKDKGADVTTMPANANIADAVQTLNERRIGAVVVTNRRGDIEGILSERDVVNALAAHGAGLMDSSISDLMTRQVFTCTPETSIE